MNATVPLVTNINSAKFPHVFCLGGDKWSGGPTYLEILPERNIKRKHFNKFYKFLVFDKDLDKEVYNTRRREC